MENSTATDYPTGTCVAPAGSESVVCEEAAATEAAASATSEDTQTGSEEDTQTGSEEDNQTGSESEG
jgi:hypothetical protein